MFEFARRLKRQFRFERAKLRVQRLEGNPIIHPHLFKCDDGANINGPSLIRTPDWLPGRLGNYYLYFGHHHGQYIRLAFADQLTGPWTIYEPGTLHLSQVKTFCGHIASPDVHVNEARREITMFFHGPLSGGNRQRSLMARSKDGVSFQSVDRVIAPAYLRGIPWGSQWIGVSHGGRLHLSPDETDFIPVDSVSVGGDGEHIRHAALQIQGSALHIYYTCKGHAPERILRCSVALSADTDKWRIIGREEILQPETPWEGALLPLRPSKAGIARHPENALRDPAIFEENDETFLLYSVAGESGIAIVRMESKAPASTV